MISLPDFREKKILFIASSKDLESNLKFSNGNIKLYREGKCINQISCTLVICIFIIGEVTLTSGIIKNIKEFGISLFLMNSSLKTYAEILSVAEGNYTLRGVQYNLSEDFELGLAKKLMNNKIQNQLSLIKEYNKLPTINSEEILQKLDEVDNYESLLGTEGSISKIYFKSLFSDIGWYRRAPTTKEDIPNFMLDIGYYFLFNFTDSCLRLFGFDTYKGFYHKLYFQRKSLTCDIMEPFRVIIDKSLLKAYNLKMINEKDFVYKNGSYGFKEFWNRRKYADIFLSAITDRKDDMYEYVLNFYRHVQNPEKYKFPIFKY